MRPSIQVVCDIVLAVFLSLVAAPLNGETGSDNSGVKNSAPLIQYQHGRVRARLQDAPWDQVVQEIERQMGITVRVKGPLSGTITQAFDDLPLEQGLRRLFRSANLAVLYAHESRAGARVSEIWLMPKAADAATDPPSEPDERLTALQMFATRGDLEGLQQALVNPDQGIQATALELLREWGPQWIIDALLRATTSDEAATRVRALTLLQQIEPGPAATILSTLAAALADPDIRVKTYALLPWRAAAGPRRLACCIRPCKTRRCPFERW
jgi:hypothetical protein